jgi:ParB family chromosome partitioning protein
MAQIPMEPERRSQFYNDSIFWIDVDKIKPNPYQPRKDFDQDQLKALSESIRQYGVLQALVVTRIEVQKEDGGLATEYELIAGERRLRASKLAGLREVPVLIRAGTESNLMKLELAIIENVQREDLNSVDRAKAFEQLAKQFGFTHSAIAEKVGKSREYVSNTLRILLLPENILQALSAQKITEGHTRPLLMLARHIAYDKVRKHAKVRDPEITELEHQLAETLGTRVQIEQGEKGGKVMIDYFSSDDLQGILDLLTKKIKEIVPDLPDAVPQMQETTTITEALAAEVPKKEDDQEELYSVKNFSI